MLSLGEMEFLAGIEESDLNRLGQVLTRRDFGQGEIICREGDAGDRMWLLAKGSISVRLTLGGGRESIQIASLCRGTIIGEMCLINSARRSATIVADEQVVCYELLRDDFAMMLSDHPAIGTKLLSNLARELSRRLSFDFGGSSKSKFIDPASFRFRPQTGRFTLQNQIT